MVKVNPSISINLFNNKVFNSITDSKKKDTSTDFITPEQVRNLEDILNLYCTPLSQKQWEKINTDENLYLETLGKLLSVDLNEPQLKLLLSISEDALTGSVNSIPTYTKLIYNELKKYELNAEISDILSNKNVESVLSLAVGNLQFVKTMTLPPLFSRYITIYGMPKFGVGFDPLKIAFIQKLTV